jgi:hypothetical protein
MTVISRRNSCADLGITISSDLSFERHINNIVFKARQRVSCCSLFRGFLSRNLRTMRLAFITYIRPLLKYNSIVWNPDFIYLIDLIENVQRNFTKRISSIASLSYPERLAILDLDLLELRRLRFYLISYTSKYSTISHLLTPLKFSPSTHQQRAPDQNCLTCKNQSMPQNVSCQLSSFETSTHGMPYQLPCAPRLLFPPLNVS